jgi:hypothetical protein
MLLLTTPCGGISRRQRWAYEIDCNSNEGEGVHQSKNAAADKAMFFPFDKRKTPPGNFSFCRAFEWGKLRAQHKKQSYGNG